MKTHNDRQALIDPTVLSSEKSSLYLVNPCSGSNVAGLTECIDLLGYRYLCANLSLPTLAAMVDESKFDVAICDENVDDIDFDRPCDIVGLTIYHYQRERTFEIAREFRKRGRLVIVGGPYATQNLQSGHPLFDVVFCGEAELTWPQFLDDYLRGDFHSLYQERDHPDITSLPPPRFDLMRNERYLLGALQCGRGCPHKCDFCTCTVLYGRTMRYKTNDQIIAELEQLHSLGYRSIFLLDDNLVGDRMRAREVVTAIRDWNESQAEPVMFSTSASIDIGTQSDLGKLFGEALITNVFVGIETPNKESLSGAGKHQNLRSDVQRDVELLHSYGVDIAAGIIVGFDDDDISIFHRQAAFLQELSIPVSFAGMMLAPDGTELKERLIREGRYLGGEEVKDHTCNTNVRPKNMTYDQLRNGYFWMMNELYDERNFLERVRGALARFPEPSALARRYKPREMRDPLKFVSIMARLLSYYITGGSTLRWLLWRYLLVILKYRRQAAVAIYWLIAFKHFREMLIRNGVLKNVDFDDTTCENRDVEEYYSATP
ncbi:MAG: DUF4070 domain-containing protein [candidate division Zixibacteria bacterium]|nr:DUF4070 domain-containing protein [candidate division Zixibacteria bacterium]